MHHRHGDFGRRLSQAERLEIRRLVRAGEPYRVVATAVGTTPKTIGLLMRTTGGLPDRTSARSPLRLSVAEREEISRELRRGGSLRSIARGLRRAPSTVSREIVRNGGRRRYRAWRAETGASERARRPRPAKLARNARLRAEVEHGLGLRWSPEQIAARLRLDHPGDRQMQVSHETIYQSLFVQARGALARELRACLRTGRVRRRTQHRTAGPGKLTDMVLISERPAEVDDRAVPGHWEGDLIIGGRSHSAIATLVERQTRYVLLVGLPAGRSARPSGTLWRPGSGACPTSSAGRSPGTVATRWPSTSGSRSTPASRSTSAIPGAPGNGAATRTPTASSGSTSRRAPISRSTTRPISTRSPGSSTIGLDRRSAG